MPEKGDILQGRYMIQDLLGHGGSGAVYKAYDQRLQQTVALKVAFHHTPGFLRQFKREALLLARLRHYALPAVIDHFQEEKDYYLVMDYVPGEDLSCYVEEHPAQCMNEHYTLHIITPLLDALAYLHSLDPPIIHRDIKPDNIRIGQQGNVFLVDFGIAKAYKPDQKTTIGARWKTPGFAPLEQYGSGATDRRTDLYAIGATLYFLLSGGTCPPEAPDRVNQDTLIPLRQLNPSVSPQMEQIVTRLLAILPDDRYANVAALRHDLATLPATEDVAESLADHPAATRDTIAEKTVMLKPSAPLRNKGVVIAGSVLVLLMMMLFVMGMFPAPIPPMPAGQIVFRSNRDGAYNLYTMQPDGTNLQQLTDGPSHTWAPSVSADGQFITYQAKHRGSADIFVRSLAGSQPQNLTNDLAYDDYPDWSPDGSLLAFQSNHDGDYDIYVMQRDGRNVQQITRNPAYDGMPAWSPDGRLLAFVSNREYRNDIYVMQSDGSNIRNLTNSQADDRSPAWSPDGRTIAYQSNRDGNHDIYLIDADGSNVRKLTDHPAYDGYPSWSPDGRFLAFLSTRDGNGEISIMQRDGSNVRNITMHAADDADPFWYGAP